MSAVEIILKRTDRRCHATVCRDGSCSLSLEGAPAPSVLISLEHEAAPVEADQARCDYLFAGGGSASGAPWVAPVELTASAARVSKFLPQLRAGADIADRLLPQNAQVRFRPVAAYGGELRRTERDGFLKSANRVGFRKSSVPIKLVRCGSPLSNALRQ